MLLATGTPRYTTVFSPGAQVHVIWDHLLGEFCTLPGPGGPVLLAFDHSYFVLKWFMACQEGGLTMEMPDGAAPVPSPVPVY